MIVKNILFYFFLLSIANCFAQSTDFFKALHSDSNDEVFCSAVSLNGKYMALAGNTDLSIYDLHSYALLKTMKLNNSQQISGIQFGFNDSILLISQQDFSSFLFDRPNKVVYAYNWQTANKTSDSFNNIFFQSVTRANDGLTLFIQNEYYYFTNNSGEKTKAPRKSLVSSQLQTTKEKYTRGFEFQEARCYNISNDGNLLAIGFHKYTLVLDALTLKTIDSIPGISSINPAQQVMFSPDSRFLCYFYQESKNAIIYDIENKTVYAYCTNIDRDSPILNIDVNDSIIAINDGRYLDIFRLNDTALLFSEKCYLLKSAGLDHVNTIRIIDKDHILLSGYYYQPGANKAVSILFDYKKYFEFSELTKPAGAQSELSQLNECKAMTQLWHEDNLTGPIQISNSNFITVSAKSVFVWDKSSLMRVNAYVFPENIQQYALSDDGQVLIVFTEYGKNLDLIFLSNGEQLTITRTKKFNFEFSIIQHFALFGSKYLFTYDNHDLSYIYNIEKREFTGSFQIPFKIAAVLPGFSFREGIAQYIKTEDGRLLLYDPVNNRIIQETKPSFADFRLFQFGNDKCAITEGDKISLYVNSKNALEELYDFNLNINIMGVSAVKPETIFVYYEDKATNTDYASIINIRLKQENNIVAQQYTEEAGMINDHTIYLVDYSDGISFWDVNSKSIFFNIKRLKQNEGSDVWLDHISLKNQFFSSGRCILDMKNANIKYTSDMQEITISDDNSFLQNLVLNFLTEQERIGIAKMNYAGDTIAVASILKPKDIFFGFEYTDVSPAGNYAASVTSGRIAFCDLKNFRFLSTFPFNGSTSYKADWSEKGDNFVFLENTESGFEYSLKLFKLSKSSAVKIKSPACDIMTNVCFTDNDSIVLIGKNVIRNYNIYTGIYGQDYFYHPQYITKMLYDHKNDILVCGMENGEIFVWDYFNKKLLYRLWMHKAAILDLKNDNDKLISSSDDQSICIWDMKNGNFLANYYQYNDGGKNQYCFMTKEGFYKSSKNVSSLLHFVIKNTAYPLEQFDLKYNRPDIVLERLGYADSTLIEAYHGAYLKRIKRMGFTEEQLSGEFHIPETAIENFEYMPVIDEKDIELVMNFRDDKYKVDRYNIWINEVPLYGMAGKSLRTFNALEYSIKESVELMQGENKIQVSCLNEKGAESYKESVYVTYQPKEPVTGKNYLVAISVSDYKDARYNLNYAVKDGRDMATMFAGKDCSIDTLFNQNATRESILALKQKLMQTKVDDEVILYVSGHGLLDKNYDFYFATYDMNFKNPAERGILYDDLEGLLDGIPARKKLLLMDACHSGEVDKEDIRTADSLLANAEAKGDLKVYSYKGTDIESEVSSGLGLQNSFELMQELFANLSRGSGAVVISAASGVGYALESADWNNGVFTYCILNGLKNKDGKMPADANNDGQVSVSELKDYVSVEVERLTNGAQKPTSRRESLEFDWRVW